MFSEDSELVQATLRGSPRESGEAFSRLVRKYNRMAGAIAFGVCGDFQAAEDIVQEAFLKAYRSLRKLRDPAKFKAWFAGIVRSKSIDLVRQRKGAWSFPRTESQSGLNLADLESYSAEPVEDLLLKEEFRSKVLEAIRSLPEADRTVVTLKHMEGLSYKEIAEITGATTSSIESRLFRARASLRKKLDRILK